MDAWRRTITKAIPLLQDWLFTKITTTDWHRDCHWSCILSPDEDVSVGLQRTKKSIVYILKLTTESKLTKNTWLSGERALFTRNYINMQPIYNNRTLRPNLEQSLGTLFITVYKYYERNMSYLCFLTISFNMNNWFHLVPSVDRWEQWEWTRCIQTCCLR